MILGLICWRTRSDNCKSKYKMGRVPIICICGKKIGERNKKGDETRATGLCFVCMSKRH